MELDFSRIGRAKARRYRAVTFKYLNSEYSSYSFCARPRYIRDKFLRYKTKLRPSSVVALAQKLTNVFPGQAMRRRSLVGLAALGFGIFFQRLRYFVCGHLQKLARH